MVTASRTPDAAQDLCRCPGPVSWAAPAAFSWVVRARAGTEGCLEPPTGRGWAVAEAVSVGDVRPPGD